MQYLTAAKSTQMRDVIAPHFISDTVPIVTERSANSCSGGERYRTPRAHHDLYKAHTAFKDRLHILGAARGSIFLLAAFSFGSSLFWCDTAPAVQEPA